MNRLKLLNELVDIGKIANGNIVYILGHKFTDTDSYISMLLIEKLLNKFGINAVPCLLIEEEAIDSRTKRIIEDFNCKYILNEIISSNDYFFLVDHNNFNESYPEMKKENILGIIDHHQDEGLIAPFRYIQPAGSTTRIIYEMLEALDIHVSVEEKEQILISLLVDTSFLMSTKTNPEDITLAKSLLKELGLNLDSLKKHYLVPTDLNLPIDQLAMNGLKEYKIDDYLVGSSYVEYLGDDKELVYSKIPEIKRIVSDKKYDLFVYMLTDLTLGATEVMLIEGKNKDIHNISFSQIASRGKTVMPIVREKISQGILLG